MSDLTLISQTPQAKALAKKISKASKAHVHLIDAALAIHAEPDAAERAFMARQLVLCTLPHSDPGNVPSWVRRTATGSLVLRPGWANNKSLGFPYGSIPRLLLFWVIGEAVRTKSRRLVLGKSLSQFARAIGLNPDTGNGKRGDSKRLKEQMRRLFRCHITFDESSTDALGNVAESWGEYALTSEGTFWWAPHPAQETLFESWIELGEKFYRDVISAPVPLDLRALQSLKRSPLALDLYAMICYRAFALVKNQMPPQFISWEQLRRQLGTEYGDIKDFKKKGLAALRKIAVLYPGLTVGPARGGFTLHATRLAVPQKME